MNYSRLRGLIVRFEQTARVLQFIPLDPSVDPDILRSEASAARKALFDYIRECEWDSKQGKTT